MTKRSLQDDEVAVSIHFLINCVDALKNMEEAAKTANNPLINEALEKVSYCRSQIERRLEIHVQIHGLK